MTITALNNRLYKDEGVLFLERGDVVMISLDARQVEINWDSFLALGKEIAAEGKYILWDVDFKFQEHPVFIQDSHLFFSFSLFLEEFAQKLWLPLEEYSFGVSLYKGSLDFSSCFLWTEQQEQHYREKAEEYPLLVNNKEFRKQLFDVDLFFEYLHRMGSVLPEAALICCLLSLSAQNTQAELAVLLSSERVPHMTLALKGTAMPLGPLGWDLEGVHTRSLEEPSVGVCLPEGEFLSESVLQSLDVIFSLLQEKEITFRVMEEGRLHEQWDGIDDLIVLSSCMSIQGIRKLKGFIAAGGRVVSCGELLHLEEEMQWSSFIS